MNFIDILLELLKKNGITKNKLLSDLQLGKNSFVNWSSRGTIPSGETLQRIADYFGVTVDYLLGKEEQAARSADSVFSLSKEEQEILLTYRENEAFREAVMNIYRLTKPAEQKTVRVFRAARSADNHGPEVVDMDAARLERLKNLPDTDDPL